MPRIIDYPIVLDQMTKEGFRSLYHNSGAFGFAASASTVSRGWIGPVDPSIRAAAMLLVRQIHEPFAQRMTGMMIQLWQQSLPGSVWVMPKSHWAYELEFGSREWLPEVLNKIDVDPAKLLPLNNAAALEFQAGESESLGYLVRELLLYLVGSDFQMVFSGRRTICTIHTRQQLWWTTADPIIAERMESLLPAEPDIDENT
jgi:hypothetical protein